MLRAMSVVRCKSTERTRKKRPYLLCEKDEKENSRKLDEPVFKKNKPPATQRRPVLCDTKLPVDLEFFGQHQPIVLKTRHTLKVTLTTWRFLHAPILQLTHDPLGGKVALRKMVGESPFGRR